MEDITRLIVDESKLNGNDVNVIVKGKKKNFFHSKMISFLFVDPLAHTIPAAFYRNFNRDLIIEYVPIKRG
jgi:hypothetical protein